ncbi:MAG: GNAT family N-acetyltransferase, partial [Raoultibacter sp.]
TVYLDRAFRAKGCGRLLCETLLDLLEAQGIRNVFSLITVPNEASFRLHEALGFEYRGVQKHAGYKDDAWHDVAWLQKSFGNFSSAPSELVPITELEDSLTTAIFARAHERSVQHMLACIAGQTTTHTSKPAMTTAGSQLDQ